MDEHTDRSLDKPSENDLRSRDAETVDTPEAEDTFVNERGTHQSNGRYHDSFYEEMRIPEDGPLPFESPFDERYIPRKSKDKDNLYDASAQTAGEKGELGETAADPTISLSSTQISENTRAARARTRVTNVSSLGDTEQFAPVESEHRIPLDRERLERARKSYSRAAVERDIAGGRYGEEAKSTVVSKKTTRRRGVHVAFAVLIVLVLVGAGAAFAYLSTVAGNLGEGISQELRASLVKTDMSKEPFYMLLLGTDGSAEREEDEGFGGSYRSDSMLLARVDAPNKKVTLVTIPRDIPVDLGEYGEEKINAAYAFGGPALAVKAVSELAGVPISHYAEIDFDGFRAMVDSLGGVEVDVPMYIDDWEAGGVVEAGRQTLDGEHALILCRARHAFDEFGDGDQYRAANQRLVLSAIAHKVLDADIATIARTVQAASEYVATDLALNDIIGLSQALTGLNPDTDVYTASVPTNSQYVNGGWYEFPDKEAWAAMMQRVNSGLPPLEQGEVDPYTGVVMATVGEGVGQVADKACSIVVKNATEISGLAGRTRTKLSSEGYTNVQLGETNSKYSYPQTLVVYENPAHEADAQDVLNIIGQGSLYFNSDLIYAMNGADVMVVIGEDWKEE